MIKFFIVILLASNSATAFVAGPSAVNTGENFISIGAQAERGKVEPNENKNSYQDAQIDIYKLKYVRGLDRLLGLSWTSIYFEFGSFTSAQEQVGSTFFYEKDLGTYLTLGFSGDFVHETGKQFGFYLQISPSRSYNKIKFSNPRLDTFSFGLTSAVDLSDNFFQRNLIHVGSGDSTSQNSYLAIDTGFGYKLSHWVGRQLTVLGSLFIEGDTTERKDQSYDTAFSPAGTQDRIRAFKYGTLLGLDVALSDEMNLTANYLQKLGGYDARSTQIYSLNIGYKF